jgi:hypothetical protein
MRAAEDTDPEAKAELVRRMRQLSVEEKAEQVVALIQAAREMAMAGLRSRYPEASAEELRLRLAALVLDADTVRKVHGWDPEREGY